MLRNVTFGSATKQGRWMAIVYGHVWFRLLWRAPSWGARGYSSHISHIIIQSTISPTVSGAEPMKLGTFENRRSNLRPKRVAGSATDAELLYLLDALEWLEEWWIKPREKPWDRWELWDEGDYGIRVEQDHCLGGFKLGTRRKRAITAKNTRPANTPGNGRCTLGISN